MLRVDVCMFDPRDKKYPSKDYEEWEFEDDYEEWDYEDEYDDYDDRD